MGNSANQNLTILYRYQWTKKLIKLCKVNIKIKMLIQVLDYGILILCMKLCQQCKVADFVSNISCTRTNTYTHTHAYMFM